MTFDVYDSSNLTNYELKYRTKFWPLWFANLASDPDGNFTVVLPPNTPEGPAYSWIGIPSDPPAFAAWTHRTYPQDVWVKQVPECVDGVACANLTIAPSMRYQHTAVMYRSWNFTRDVLGHPTLCRLGSDNSACTETCLTDTSCLRTDFQNPWSNENYFDTVSDASFWADSDYFGSDDGETESSLDPHSATCPPACCGERRLCMRTRDALGQPVPFDKSYMLVFGGQTREKTIIDDQDLYLHCEALVGGGNLDESMNSCLQFNSEELWRLDVAGDTWELIKPGTLEVAVSSTTPVYPYGRYGHAAALAIIDAANDLQNTRRQYMFIFGGFSINCLNGLCADLWRYEIPWAAQAYWPTSGATSMPTYLRGNTWKRLKDCPFGGLYRHTMVATESGSALYVYGGQQAGSYESTLLVYTLASDSWETKQAVGYRSFTRRVYDYLGRGVTTVITDLESYGELLVAEDALGTPVSAAAGGQLPLQRGDHSSLMMTDSIGNQSVLILNGFRTYDSPYPKTDSTQDPYPSYPYYLEDDIWRFDLGSSTWTRVLFQRNSAWAYPSPRRGAAAAAIPRGDADDVLVVFGGYRADSPLNDMWMLEVQRTVKAERKWQRLDTVLPGSLPPNVTYHSMLYDPLGDQLLLFGGLSWTSSNLTYSDNLTDTDRRCFMGARNVLIVTCLDPEAVDEAACALAQAKADIVSKCHAGTSNFCCGAEGQFNSVLSLVALNSLCTTQCQLNAFQPQLSLDFGSGLWVFSPNVCLNNCSGNGDCSFAQCLCRPGWSGADCSLPVCLGSVCYQDPVSLEQRCSHCSSNGVCNGDGVCECDAGWTGEDCSMTGCLTNCTVNGQCLDTEFPLNQCVCQPTYSGTACQDRLCLNMCSGAGSCQANGTCTCIDGFHGDDCSVYMMTAGVDRVWGFGVVWIVVAVVLIAVN